MNTQEKNRRIAELIGWRECHIYPRNSINTSAYLGGYPPGEKGTLEEYGIGNPIPDYCHDLNAIAQAEATLTGDQRWKYAKAIHDIVNCDFHGDFEAVTATASVRADALLLVLSALSVDGGEKPL